jgi:transposase
VAVTVAAADEGDTSTLAQTVPQAGANLAEAAGATVDKAGLKVDQAGPLNVVGDKGYHSNQALTARKDWEVRSYISEPERGRRR